MSHRILVVEDESAFNHLVVEALTADGFQAEGVLTGREARGALERSAWDAVVLDARLPDADGVTILREARELQPNLVVMLMTGFPNVDRVVEALKLGASDYLGKPFEAAELIGRLRTLLPTDERVPSDREGAARLVGQSAAMMRLRALVRRIAASPASTVLITGESGSGKDLVARAIHAESRRASQPFMTITCTAIAETLFETELFGHERGAFTGAEIRKRGQLELAHRGTVFLDEIGDLAPSLQAKLLRFLEERTFKRVGGATDVAVDVRVVAATHQPLDERVAEGRFREDLLHRIKVVDVHVPPLRERLEDVPELAQLFLERYAAQLSQRVRGFTPEALELLRGYGWPGNVRELRNTIERAVVLCEGDVVGARDLPPRVREPWRARDIAGALPPEEALYQLPRSGVDLERLERELLDQALVRADGNKTAAGRLLGLTRDQVRYRLAKLDETAPPGDASAS